MLPRPRTYWDVLRMWRAVAAVVLVLGSAVSLLGAWAWHGALASTGRQRFDLAAQGVKETVTNSLRHYDDLVGVLSSVFSQAGQPTRAQFADLVEGFDLTRRYPGVFGVGFVALVPPADLGAFVASARREVPGYVPYPPGARQQYCLGSYATWSGPFSACPCSAWICALTPSWTKRSLRPVTVARRALCPVRPWGSRGRPISLSSPRSIRADLARSKGITQRCWAGWPGSSTRP